MRGTLTWQRRCATQYGQVLYTYLAKPTLCAGAKAVAGTARARIAAAVIFMVAVQQDLSAGESEDKQFAAMQIPIGKMLGKDRSLRKPREC